MGFTRKILEKLGVRRPPKPSISFEQLFEIISAMEEVSQGILQFRHKNQNKYIDNLRSFIKKYQDIDLQKYITVEEVNEYQLHATHKHSFQPQYEITIQNLIINVETDIKSNKNFRDLYLLQTPGDTSFPAGTGLFFKFNNNNFASSKNSANQDTKSQITTELAISVKGEVRVDFINNIFTNVEFSLNILEWIQVSEKFHKVLPIEALGKRNTKSESTLKGGAMFTNWEVSQSTIMEHKYSKILEETVNRYMKSIKYKQNRSGNKSLKRCNIVLRPEDVKRINRSYLVFKDNTISKLIVNFPVQIDFDGKNIINCIVRGPRYGFSTSFDHNDSSNVGFSVYWGPYNEIDSKGKYAKPNMDFFLYLRSQAARNQDKPQEAIINREIIKCQHNLIKNQWSIKALQDRFILRFGKCVSNHGTSFLMPIVWILLVNVATTLIITSLLGHSLLSWNDLLNWSNSLNWSSLLNWDSLSNLYGLLNWNNLAVFTAIFVDAFNPFSAIPEPPKNKDMDINIQLSMAISIWINLIYIFQKLVLAIMTYEIIRTGRRFVIK